MQRASFLLMPLNLRFLARYRLPRVVELLLQPMAFGHLVLATTPKNKANHPQGRLEFRPYFRP
jgi:hypothetical protein